MRNLKIGPATEKDNEYFSYENQTTLVNKIKKTESKPGKFSLRESDIDPETKGFGMILGGITVVIALIVSIPVGMILVSGGSSLWLLLYLFCLPTGSLALLLGFAVMMQAANEKEYWAARRRYAYSKGWLTEYTLEVEMFKSSKSIRNLSAENERKGNTRTRD